MSIENESRMNSVSQHCPADCQYCPLIFTDQSIEKFRPCYLAKQVSDREDNRHRQQVFNSRFFRFLNADELEVEQFPRLWILDGSSEKADLDCIQWGLRNDRFDQLVLCLRDETDYEFLFKELDLHQKDIGLAVLCELDAHRYYFWVQKLRKRWPHLSERLQRIESLTELQSIPESQQTEECRLQASFVVYFADQSSFDETLFYKFVKKALSYEQFEVLLVFSEKSGVAGVDQGYGERLKLIHSGDKLSSRSFGRAIDAAAGEQIFFVDSKSMSMYGNHCFENIEKKQVGRLGRLGIAGESGGVRQWKWYENTWDGFFVSRKALNRAGGPNTQREPIDLALLEWTYRLHRLGYVLAVEKGLLRDRGLRIERSSGEQIERLMFDHPDVEVFERAFVRENKSQFWLALKVAAKKSQLISLLSFTTGLFFSLLAFLGKNSRSIDTIGPADVRFLNLLRMGASRIQDVSVWSGSLMLTPVLVVLYWFGGLLERLGHGLLWMFYPITGVFRHLWCWCLHLFYKVSSLFVMLFNRVLHLKYKIQTVFHALISYIMHGFYWVMAMTRSVFHQFLIGYYRMVSFFAVVFHKVIQVRFLFSVAFVRMYHFILGRAIRFKSLMLIFSYKLRDSVLLLFNRENPLLKGVRTFFWALSYYPLRKPYYYLKYRLAILFKDKSAEAPQDSDAQMVTDNGLRNSNEQ